MKLCKIYNFNNDLIIIYKIVKLFFEISQSSLEKEDIGNIYGFYAVINLYVNENIHDKFSRIANDDEDIEGESIFDEFVEDEKIENVDDDANIYEKYLEILNYNMEYSIKCLKNSYKESCNCNLIDLLDFIIFDKKVNIKSDIDEEDIY